METFTPIAMKCTQEQFDAVRPKLEHLKVILIDSFIICGYLINNLSDTPFSISNVSELGKKAYNRKVYEYWNEEIFLKACGIEVETLQEKEQRLLTELEEVRKEIEENKIKVNDWVIVNEEKLIFKASDYDVQFLGNIHKKITNPELIKLLEQEIK